MAGVSVYFGLFLRCPFEQMSEIVYAVGNCDLVDLGLDTVKAIVAEVFPELRSAGNVDQSLILAQFHPTTGSLPPSWALVLRQGIQACPAPSRVTPARGIPPGENDRKEYRKPKIASMPES
jgi:hypothetical protein